MLDFRRKQPPGWWVVFSGIVLVFSGLTSHLAAAPAAKSKHPVKATPTPAATAAATETPSANVPETAGTPPGRADVPAADSAAPALPPLTAADMKDAVSLDVITVPTPGELFAALNKQCKPNWTAEFRGPLTTAYSDRAQAALNLGGLIADGYVAVEAMDAQQVKNLGRDILALAKNLGISKEILVRGESIKQFSDDSDWLALKEELEAMQNEVKQEMDSLHDDDLITLLSLGAWIRGTNVVSDVVLKNYGPNTTCILRQPALVGYLQSKLDKLSPRMKESPTVKTATEGLASLSKLVSFPLGEVASKEDVQKLHDQAAEVLKGIARKDG